MVVASMKIVSVGVHNNMDIHVCTLQYSQRILFTTTKIVGSNFVFYWHLHFIAVIEWQISFTKDQHCVHKNM